jgi:hypothetical protein
MKILSAFLLVVLTFTTPLFAQDTEAQVIHQFGTWTDEDSSAYIFSEIANVRADDNPKAEIAGKLLIGTSVKIIGISPVDFSQNGITAPWVYIETPELSGYVWGGVLTKGLSRLDDGRTALWGLTSKRTTADDFNQTFASIRVCEGGALITKQDFEVLYGNRPDEGYLSVLPAPLLENTAHVLVFETLSEACGVYASAHYFVYGESKLSFVGSGYSMGDGGMLHESRDFIFPYPPVDGESRDYHYVASEGHILRIENEGGYDDDCIWIETIKAADFTWDGEKLVKACEE